MKMYLQSNSRSKETSNNVPNMVAIAAIKNFLTSKDFKETREGFCINNLSKDQVNKIMYDIKWLFKNYKDLEVLAIEDAENKIVKFVL